MVTERCRYEEIRSLCIDQLAHAWMEDPTTCTSVCKKIDSLVEEGLEHATEVVSALWDIANNDDYVKAPAKTQPPVRPLQFFLLRVM